MWSVYQTNACNDDQMYVLQSWASYKAGTTCNTEKILMADKEVQIYRLSGHSKLSLECEWKWLFVYMRSSDVAIKYFYYTLWDWELKTKYMYSLTGL